MDGLTVQGRTAIIMSTHVIPEGRVSWALPRVITLDGALVTWEAWLPI